jgi:hypothetical protein
MNPLRFIQQVVSRLGFRGRPGPYVIDDTTKTQDPLTNAIDALLFIAIRNGATEIRFVPNERNLRAYMLVKDGLQEWYSPFLKRTAGPIARLLKQMLGGDALNSDIEAMTAGTIYIGRFPVHLSLSATPTECGDLLALRIVDPALAEGATVCDPDEFDLVSDECAADDEDPPAPPTPPPTEEEIREASREILGCLNPAIYDVTDG